jgi:hypothetical protein
MYGNDHKLVKDPQIVGEDLENKHEWTVYVRMADKKDDITKYI